MKPLGKTVKELFFFILSLSSPSKRVLFLYLLRYQPHSSCFIDGSCHSCMSYTILYKRLETSHLFTLKYKYMIAMSIFPRYFENNDLLLKRNKFQMEEHRIWLCAFRIKLWAHVNTTGQFFKESHVHICYFLFEKKNLHYSLQF